MVTVVLAEMVTSEVQTITEVLAEIVTSEDQTVTEVREEMVASEVQTVTEVLVEMITLEVRAEMEEILMVGIREDRREHHLVEDQGTGLITQTHQVIEMGLKEGRATLSGQRVIRIRTTAQEQMKIIKIIANPDKMTVLNRVVRAVPVLLKVSDNIRI